MPESQTWTLRELVASAAQTWGDSTALVFDGTDERLSFGELEVRSNALANVFFDAGLRRGDRVAVMLKNRPEFPLCWLALAKIGAQMVPLNTHFQLFDACRVLEHSQPGAVVTSSEFISVIRSCKSEDVRLVFDVDGGGEGAADLALAAASAPTTPPSTVVRTEDAVSIQYTSGTTGTPKGCMLSNSYWSFLIRRLVDEFPRMTAADVMLTAQPFYYLDPQWNLGVAMAAGSPLVVLDRFHPSTFWQRVRAHKVTFFYCLGLMPTLLHKSKPDPGDRDHHLRFVWCSAIPPEIHRELEDRFGVCWLEISGMTESGADLYVSPEEHDELVGSGCVGRPYSVREARVVDDRDQAVGWDEVGELVYRGPGVFDGYFRDEQATQTVFRNGWFHTGDLVRKDDAGRFYYIGRKQEVIRRSGETISAVEVENVLQSHAAIRMAACAPVPDDLRGQEVKAYIVLQPGCKPSEVGPELLAAFCLERLAYFKVPRYWEFRDELPLTSSERVKKNELVGEASDLRARSYDRVEKIWRD